MHGTSQDLDARLVPWLRSPLPRVPTSPMHRTSQARNVPRLLRSARLRSSQCARPRVNGRGLAHWLQQLECACHYATDKDKVSWYGSHCLFTMCARAQVSLCSQATESACGGVCSGKRHEHTPPQPASSAGAFGHCVSLLASAPSLLLPLLVALVAAAAGSPASFYPPLLAVGAVAVPGLASRSLAALAAPVAAACSRCAGCSVSRWLAPPPPQLALSPCPPLRSATPPTTTALGFATRHKNKRRGRGQIEGSASFATD